LCYLLLGLIHSFAESFQLFTCHGNLQNLSSKILENKFWCCLYFIVNVGTTITMWLSSQINPDRDHCQNIFVQ
jgi:hypothetical protein